MGWWPGVIGIDSPRALQNAVFYYNGKNFAYKVVKSANSLRFPRFNVFTALTATNAVNLFQKIAKAHFGFTWQTKNACPTAYDRCHVRLLDLYL